MVLPMSYDPTDNDADDIDYGPSKSELKRQSQELQVLGEALIALPQVEFDALPMPENLRDAVAIARRITAHGGLYRQKQYIGKLMRNIDAEPIRAAIDARAAQHRSETVRLKRVETWRSRLLDSGPEALDALLLDYPALDGARIKALIEQARTERARGQPPRASRELFGILRNAMGAALLE